LLLCFSTKGTILFVQGGGEHISWSSERGVEERERRKEREERMDDKCKFTKMNL